MRRTVGPDPVDVAKTVDAMLAEHDDTALQSMAKFIALLREKTGTDRSDADLTALIMKKVAVLGTALEADDQTAGPVDKGTDA